MFNQVYRLYYGDADETSTLLFPKCLLPLSSCLTLCYRCNAQTGPLDHAAMAQGLQCMPQNEWVLEFVINGHEIWGFIFRIPKTNTALVFLPRI
jgi:hypothetical protein